MSAPARNNFSIISNEDEAGPSVATCLVDFFQRCATLGTAATVVLAANDDEAGNDDNAEVVSPLAVGMVEAASRNDDTERLGGGVTTKACASIQFMSQQNKSHVDHQVMAVMKH